MKAILIVAVTWLIAAALGRTILDRVLRGSSVQPFGLRSVETLIFGSSLGLGILAYGVFALGLFAHLTSSFIAGWLALAAALGAPGARSIYLDARQAFVDRRSRSTQRSRHTFNSTIAVGSSTILIVLLCISGAACMAPPGAHAWDAIAYHLADPKIYLQLHQIVLLPTQHHSNFPFTMEMLFTIGLAFDGYAAANLFHLLTAILLTGAIFCFCTRFLTRGAGHVAAVVFTTTPLVLWESSIAYIDLGLALFIFLSTYAVILAARGAVLSGRIFESHRPHGQSALLTLGATMMGFALGTKYLALLALVFVIVLAMSRRISGRSMMRFAIVSLAVGSPWYIKNVVWMRNPVYPFAYGVFRNSKYWSEGRARPYAEEQRSFGTAHDLASPAEAVRNLAITPWRLLARPEDYTNRADFTFTSLIGGLYAGFALSLAFIRPKPGAVYDVLIVTVFMFVSWFFVSQHIRYLIPALPFGAILCGYAAEHWIGSILWSTGGKYNYRTKVVNVVRVFVSGIAVLGQIVLLAWGIAVLPVAGQAVIVAEQSGFGPTALSVPETMADLFRTGERERHMNRLGSYGADEWINRHGSSGAGVVIYEDVHGFYLDRPYLWGNGEHSSYIPYDTMRNGRDLSNWLEEHKVRFALFNLNNSPAGSHLPIPDDEDAVQALMRQWYDGNGTGWRRIVGDAIQTGEWVVRYSHHGVVVLEIGVTRS